MKKLVIILFTALMIFQTNAQGELKSIQHKVVKGQTLYFLSKKYDISIQDLMRFNPQIGKDMVIKEGMIIKVFSKPTKMLETSSYNYHTVEKGQTLYSLSKMHNISVDDLIRLNKLKTPNLSIGDEIIVKKVDSKSLFVNTKPKKNITNKKDSTDNKLKFKIETVKQNGITLNTHKDVEMYKMLYDGYKDSGATLNKAKGIGNFLEQSTSTDVYLALINGIESGQVIRLRNLMNNKVIYLKVIGSVPNKDADNNISIKISKAAAKDLKIVEDRFLAEWTWYKKAKALKTITKKNITITDF